MTQEYTCLAPCCQFKSEDANLMRHHIFFSKCKTFYTYEIASACMECGKDKELCPTGFPDILLASGASIDIEALISQKKIIHIQDASRAFPTTENEIRAEISRCKARSKSEINLFYINKVLKSYSYQRRLLDELFVDYYAKGLHGMYDTDEPRSDMLKKCSEIKIPAEYFSRRMKCCKLTSKGQRCSNNVREFSVMCSAHAG